MNEIDCLLIKTYMQGFYDCSDNIKNSYKYEGLYKNAYRLGWEDYLLGDDISSNDYRTSEEILKQIKE